MLETENTIFVSRVDEGPSTGNLALDMTMPYMAERRIPEIALVTVMTAPELLALFNEAHLQVGRYCAQLELELDRGYNRQARRRAVILLDEVPEIVKNKGLGNARSPMGSEDIRDAIVQTDTKHFDMSDKIAALKATKKLMELKLDSLKMAYDSVKKILDKKDYRVGMAPLNESIPEDARAGQTVSPSFGYQTGLAPAQYEQKPEQPTQVTAPFKGFGKPVYK